SLQSFTNFLRQTTHKPIFSPYNSTSIASYMQQKAHKSDNKYKQYLQKHKSNITQLTNGFDCFNQIFEYLTVRDVINLKQVNRTFNRLGSQPFLWQKMILKNLKINDWQYLGRNIIEPYATVELDFEGLGCSSSDLSEVWHNF